MQKEKTLTKTRLKSWLFTKPIMFTLLFLGIGIIFSIFYSLIQSVFNFESLIPMYILCALTFILPAYYMIRKLPHDNLSQSDFVAIVNGASFIAILSSMIAIFFMGINGTYFQHKIMKLYVLYPTTFFILVTLAILVSLYLLGLAISGIYAKYKRATTLGISPWKIILSMPFAFLMLWTPGYLIQDKSVKSSLEIKANWYSRFNKWVVANFGNTLFVFLFILILKGVITGLTTLTLSALLLIIYALWYTQHKSDFVKNINGGYALTAVGINIAIILAVIYSLFALGAHPY